jgi:hypothetical protein
MVVVSRVWRYLFTVFVLHTLSMLKGVPIPRCVSSLAFLIYGCNLILPFFLQNPISIRGHQTCPRNITDIHINTPKCLHAQLSVPSPSLHAGHAVHAPRHLLLLLIQSHHWPQQGHWACRIHAFREKHQHQCHPCSTPQLQDTGQTRKTRGLPCHRTGGCQYCGGHVFASQGLEPCSYVVNLLS